MYKNSIKNLLNLKEVNVKNINIFNDHIEINFSLPQKACKCPNCGALTSRVHDYRKQRVKHTKITNKPTIVIYNKRRYICKNCNKKFSEENSFVSRYSQISNDLKANIINELCKNKPASDIAKENAISPNYIQRILPYLAVKPTTLPRVLCIDEFKGNSGSQKYQVILLDGETGKVVDILECRHKWFLNEYFKSFPESVRNNVKFVVGDLWQTYKDIAFAFFRKAIYIADHFHFIRYVVGAVDKIRKVVQSKLPSNERKYFKHARRLLLGNFSKIKDEKDLEALSWILTNYSEDLRITYLEKERFMNIFYSNLSFEEKKSLLSSWILNAQSSGINELVEAANTIQHWFQPITNSFKTPFSNGVTEGKNNRIKALKRVTFGMRKFVNFKARILLLCS